MSGDGRRLGGRFGRALRPAIAVLLVALAAAGCDAAAPSLGAASLAATPPATTKAPVPTTQAISLTVLADASLTDVAPALARAYEAANADVTVTVTFGATSALAAAPGAADLLLAAGNDAPGALVDAGSSVGEQVTYGASHLALVVPKGSKKVTKLADLAKAKLVIAAAPADDPASLATDELLAAAAKTKGIPKGFASTVLKSTSARGETVRAALAAVTGGEADAAFVWATDAASAGDAVTVIKLADAINPAVSFAGVVLAGSAQGDAATAFLNWVASNPGTEILTAAGFEAAGQ